MGLANVVAPRAHFMRQTAETPRHDPPPSSAGASLGASATPSRPSLRESEAGDAPHQSPARQREELARRLLEQRTAERPQGFGLAARTLILLAAVAGCAAFWWSAARIIEQLAAG